jgi:hypothetical protein
MESKFHMYDLEDLNEQIAELKGWVKLPPPACPQWQRPTPNGVECAYVQFRWANDIDVALELLEEMRSGNQHIVIELYGCDAKNPGCMVIVYDNPTYPLKWPLPEGQEYYGSILSVAICKAYIPWKGKQNG